MRVGAFTPTEAAVMAVFYGLFIGFFVYRTLTLRDVYEMLVEAGELSALILIVVALASVFAWATATIGVVQPIATYIVGLGLGEYGTIALLMIALIIVGMFLDGVSTFLILLPVLQPIANSYGWDMVWFGVILTMKIAIGQFTPPLAVNLMVSCKIAQVPMESTIRWVFWMILAMFGALALVVVFPEYRAVAAARARLLERFVAGRYSPVPRLHNVNLPEAAERGRMHGRPAVRTCRPRVSVEAELRDRASARSRFLLWRLFAHDLIPKTGTHPATSAGQAFSGSCALARLRRRDVDADEPGARDRIRRSARRRAPRR